MKRSTLLHFQYQASANIEEVKIKMWFIPEEFKNTRKGDYALLVLWKDIDHITGYLSLNSLNLSQLEGKEEHIYEYPDNIDMRKE